MIKYILKNRITGNKKKKRILPKVLLSFAIISYGIIAVKAAVATMDNIHLSDYAFFGPQKSVEELVAEGLAHKEQSTQSAVGGGYTFGMLQSSPDISVGQPLPDQAEPDAVEPETDSQPAVPEQNTSLDNSSKPYIQLTDSEKYQLAALIYREARGESYECQLACVSVVINRFTCGQKGYEGAGKYNSIEDVIYAPSQFSPAHLIPSTTPTQTQIDAVEYVCQNGPTIPEYVCYFRASYYHNWGPKYANYTYIDETYFSYKVTVYESWLANQDN